MKLYIKKKTFFIDSILNFRYLSVLQAQTKQSRDNNSIKSSLKDIQGILVNMPLNFLREEIIHPRTFNFGKEKILPIDMWT